MEVLSPQPPNLGALAPSETRRRSLDPKRRRELKASCSVGEGTGGCESELKAETQISQAVELRSRFVVEAESLKFLHRSGVCS